jgi:hypothetical protein
MLMRRSVFDTSLFGKLDDAAVASDTEYFEAERLAQEEA